MPLKTQLRDSHGSVLEQIVFTQLALPTHIADCELRTGSRCAQLSLGAAAGRLRRGAAVREPAAVAGRPGAAAGISHDRERAADVAQRPG